MKGNPALRLKLDEAMRQGIPAKEYERLWAEVVRTKAR